MSDSPQLDRFLAEPRNVVLAGIRRDGRPQLSPNWFVWDGSLFYVSTKRQRLKYRLFGRDPRAELLIDDPTGHRSALLSGTVRIIEDVRTRLPQFRAIAEKYGRSTPASDDELVAALIADDRVLLEITPTSPPSKWNTWDLG